MTPTLEQCIILHKEKSWQAAESAYQQLLLSEPENHQLNHLIGVLYLQTKNLPDAISYFKKAIAIHNTEPSYFNNLGNAYKQNQELKESEQAYQKALSINPSYLISLNNLASLYQKQLRYSEALPLYIKSAHLDPSNIETHYALALLFIKVSKETEAITQLKNVLTLDELHLNAHFYLGTLYLNQNKLKNSKPHFLSVLTIEPEHCDALVNLGIIYLKKEQPQQAIDSFAKALAYDNNSVEAQNNMAATFMAHERYENAVPHYEDLLKKDPTNDEYLYNLGVASMHINADKKAEELFLKLINHSPDHAAAHVNLAAIFSRNEKKSKTITHLKKAIELNPNDHASIFMLQALEKKELKHASLHYVKHLFNSYAPHYEQHLKDKLNYQLPTKLKETLKSIFNNPNHFAQILDLGVGSGLLGNTLKMYASYLAGIDISPKMLELAKQKNVYNELFEQDIISFLKTNKRKFELIIAGDVIPYFGDLSLLFQLINQNLKVDGHFVLSIEKAKKSPFKLQQTGRFCHHTNYIKQLASENHLSIIEFNDLSLRNDKNTTIEGCLITLRKDLEL